MGTDEKFVCRLCLKTCEGGFEVVEEATQESLNFISLKLDLSITNEPIICNSCRDNLTKCFDFKINCLRREHQIFLPYKDEIRKLDEPTTRLCYFCIKVVEDGQFVFLESKDANMMMLEQYLPEVVNISSPNVRADVVIIYSNVINLSEESIMCKDCHESLINHLAFISNCLNVEEQIRKYCETEGTTSKGLVELSSMPQLTSKNAIGNTSSNDRVDAGKREELCCSKTESENSKIKLESGVLIGIEKQELDIKEECGDIKLEEENCDSFQLEIPLRPNVNSELGYKQSSELNKCGLRYTAYKCQWCTFETKHKWNVYRHMLVHKKSSEITMYKCQLCPFQTKYKSSLQTHVLIHKEPSEIKPHKCNLCAYQTKYKGVLRVHMRLHKMPSEIAVHKCQLCAFETKHKHNLQSHMLLHKKRSEITVYRCQLCPFQTKYKRSLRKHMLVHKEPSEVTMHKCQLCAFETKHKRNLQTHVLVHKKLSEITMYKCHLCPFQSRHKRSLQNHLLIHKESSEIMSPVHI